MNYSIKVNFKRLTRSCKNNIQNNSLIYVKMFNFLMNFRE